MQYRFAVYFGTLSKCVWVDASYGIFIVLEACSLYSYQG